MPNAIVNGIAFDYAKAGDSLPQLFDCPAYLDERGLVQCRLPAEVLRRFVMRSTDGPVEGVVIRCPVGHFFHAPTEFVSLASAHPVSASSGRPLIVAADER